MEVHDIVQETGSKTIPKKMKCKKAKWLSEEGLKIAVKRREVQSKGEKERYTHLNAVFQRRARRDQKAFLSDHAKMGTIKDRNGKDLTEAEEIKKRWQEYTQELHTKGLKNLDNHDDVVTHLEPDILECEVKWALGSSTTNKASGGDAISAELRQILKRCC